MTILRVVHRCIFVQTAPPRVRNILRETDNDSASQSNEFHMQQPRGTTVDCDGASVRSHALFALRRLKLARSAKSHQPLSTKV